MKRLLTATAVLLAAVSGASAADLNTPAPPAAPMYTKAPPPAVYSWTGFYIGGNAGGAWGSFDPRSSTVFCTTNCYFNAGNVPAVNAAGIQSINPSGFTGGFEAGYNWQASNIVFGLEGDIDSFSLKGAATSGPIVYPATPPFTFTVSSNASTSWLATVRGRLGWVAPNNWLFYATGGAAFTDLKANFAFNDNFFLGFASESASISTTRVGYTVGGGAEVPLWDHWSVKAEYLFVDFGTVSVNSANFTTILAPFPGQVFTHSIDLKASIARMGLNYRF